MYNIDFVRFKIRDLETGTVLFEIAKPPHTGNVHESVNIILSSLISCIDCGLIVFIHSYCRINSIK